MNNHHDKTHQFPITDSCKKAVIDKTLKLDKEAVRESAASPAATRQEVCSPASRILLCFLFLRVSRRVLRLSPFLRFRDFPASFPGGFFSVFGSVFWLFRLFRFGGFLFFYRSSFLRLLTGLEVGFSVGVTLLPVNTPPSGGTSSPAVDWAQTPHGPVLSPARSGTYSLRSFRYHYLWLPLSRPHLYSGR